MPKLVIFGTGLVAEVAHFYFSRDTAFEVVAFTNGREFLTGSKCAGLEVVPFEDLELSHPPSEYSLFVALGYKQRNAIRERRYRQAKGKGYTLATYVSPRATYYGTPVGDNCFIFENNVIQPFVTIGNNVTLWSGNHIGHHSTIMDHCFISSHVVVSGVCRVEQNCFLGVNCTLRDNVAVGAHTIIGAGAMVMENCPSNAVLMPDLSTQKLVVKELPQ